MTVHIGKDLLAQNIQHEKRILELEAELKSANENIAQLNHELNQKTELINILTDNEEALSENGKIFLQGLESTKPMNLSEPIL